MKGWSSRRSKAGIWRRLGLTSFACAALLSSCSGPSAPLTNLHIRAGGRHIECLELAVARVTAEGRVLGPLHGHDTLADDARADSAGAAELHAAADQLPAADPVRSAALAFAATPNATPGTAAYDNLNRLCGREFGQAETRYFSNVCHMIFRSADG